MVKNLPTKQEMPVLYLGCEDILEKEMATDSSVLREGNGNPLQYSCLENSTDRGDWQAVVRGVAKSQT